MNLSTDTKKIEELELSVRAYNCLKRHGIETVGQLKSMTEEDLMNVRNMGKKNIIEIEEKLKEEALKNKKIYIAGKITGLAAEEAIKNFNEAEDKLMQQGAITFNPTCLPEGLEWEDYLHICLAAIDRCDGVYMLGNWYESKGAQIEHQYAIDTGKELYYQIVKEK